MNEESNSEFLIQSNINSSQAINDTSEIVNINLLNARMQNEELQKLNYEIIQKKKFLNLMGSKMD